MARPRLDGQPTKQHEAFQKRVIVSTVKSEPRAGDLRVIDFDPHNLALERFARNEWEHEGYYTSLAMACRDGVNLAGAKGFPEASSVVEAINRSTELLSPAVRIK